jgi:DNA repair protein SbcC/Rad50
MKLKLTNFKCHRDSTFTFVEQGITLLIGESGKGKTTILDAIVFAFYGKALRPFSHGAKTCTVELESEKFNLKIKRTRVPNRLIVTHKDVVYEDDNGQGVIDKLLQVDSEEFQISSYFNQRKQRSIFSMSPAEQLQFVETIAYYNKDHEIMKEKIKNHIKLLDIEYSKLNNQIELNQNQLDFHKNNLKIEEEFLNEKNIKNKNSAKNIDNIKSEHEEIFQSLQKLQTLINKKRKEFEEIRKFEEEKNKFDIQKTQLESELQFNIKARKELGIAKTEDELKILQEQSKELHQNIQYVNDFKKANKLKNEFEELSKQYFENLENELKNMKNKILNEEKLKELTEIVNNYEELRIKYDKNEITKKNQENEKMLYDKLFEKIRVIVVPKGIKKVNFESLCKFANINIEKYEKTVKNLEVMIEDSQHLSLKCPKCEANLLLKNNELLISETTENNTVSIEDKKEELKINIEKHKLLLSQLDELNNLKNKIDLHIPILDIKIISLKEFQALSLQIDEQRQLLITIKNLENKINKKELSDILSKLNKQYIESFRGLPSDIDKLDLNKIISEAKDIDNLIEEGWRIKGDFSKYTREINSLENKILSLSSKRFLKSNVETPDSSEIYKKIQNLESQAQELSLKLNNLKSELSLAEKYIIYEKNKNEIDKLLLIKSELSQKHRELKDRITGANSLETISREAEMLSLEKTIESINEHAKIYLSQMFVHPIVAKLCVKRTTKKGDLLIKPSIDAYVEYKGNVTMTEDLSAGENQLCDLAFLIGVNDMLGSSILLLDECFNNLHQELNTEVLEYIKNLCKDKQVIMISHEAVHGTFDNLVKL